MAQPGIPVGVQLWNILGCSCGIPVGVQLWGAAVEYLWGAAMVSVGGGGDSREGVYRAPSSGVGSERELGRHIFSTLHLCTARGPPSCAQILARLDNEQCPILKVLTGSHHVGLAGTHQQGRARSDLRAAAGRPRGGGGWVGRRRRLAGGARGGRSEWMYELPTIGPPVDVLPAASYNGLPTAF